jgi:hypothetical protein
VGDLAAWLLQSQLLRVEHPSRCTKHTALLVGAGDLHRCDDPFARALLEGHALGRIPAWRAIQILPLSRPCIERTRVHM